MDVINWGDANSCACVGSTCATCSIRPSNEISLNNGTVRARYLITRLCPNSGPPSSTNSCAQPATLTVANSTDKGGESYSKIGVGTSAAAAPYYRIIVRTVGGRNTVSFTETIVH